MTKAPAPRLLHKRVSIRRSGKVVRDVLAQSLVSEIKQGRLKRDDEISADETHWVRLDRHGQLAKFFSTESPNFESLPSDMEERMIELSEMLKDLS